MSLYNDASLVMIPSAYKDGKLYSIKPTDGSGDFTFSRGSNLAATRVNSSGLIEKGRENLLLQSNQFDTTWLNQLGGTITGGQSGYDGSNDAWSISKDTSIYRSIRQVISWSGVSTFSVYAKSGSLSDAALRLDTGAGAIQILFDLTDGSVTSTGGTYIDAGSNDIGDGWYRLYVSANVSSGTNVHIYADRDGTTAGNIYIQDAQLEVGLVATDYIETTTTTAVSGITEDLPRLDYSGSCPSLLLEPQRTNSVEFSEYFEGSYWISTRLDLSIDSSNSPEGVSNAYNIVPTATSGTHYIYGSTSVTSGQDQTFSFYAKANGYDYFSIRFNTNNGVFGNDEIVFNLNDGSIESQDADITNSSIEPVGNDWYRVSATRESLASDIGFILIRIFSDATTDSFTGDGTSGILFYGAQWEQDASYPTSYIPCYGAATTRSFDSCTNADVSSLLGSGTGTAFIDLVVNGEDTQGNIPLTIGTGTANLVYLWILKSNRSIRYEAYTSGTLQGLVTTNTGFYTYGDRIKVALVWADNDFAMYINGTLIGTDTSGTAPTPTKLWLGQYTSGNYKGASISQVSLFPTRLTNAELAALTTI